MRIIISGSSGLIGSALVPALEAAGHQVVRLVRTSTDGASGEISWNPTAGDLHPDAVEGVDAVINLNGRSIAGDRWSPQIREDLRASRLDPTTTLADAVRRAKRPPSLLINASAVGFYGDRGEESLDESSSSGEGFLAELSRDWEAAALATRSEDTRVVLLRLGMVLAREGALGKMLTPFKLGLGGPVGSGRQFWPWVAIDDVSGIVDFILHRPEIVGPVNVVAPQETRCSEFARTLGRVLSRPAILPAPAFAVRLALGEMADSLLLASQRVRPKILETAGYEFRNPTLDGAIRTALSR